MKQKDHNEVRFLKGRIRELEKENRQLKKLVGYQDKRKHLFENAEIEKEVEAEIAITGPELKTCKECARGKMVELDLGLAVYATCNICDHREKVR